STPKIWRIENGAVSMRSLDVEQMCRVYRAPADVTEALMALAKETKARGWWHSYGDVIPAWFELYVGLETAASRLRKYEAELMPGLLQTKAYAAEAVRVGLPEMSEADIERTVAVRLGRQALLTRVLPAPPQLDVILNESVLRRSTDDRAAMAGQLHHIVETGQLPNVSVRVLPLGSLHRAAAMANGAFTILDFPDNAEPSTVYSQGLTGALYLDKPAEVTAYEDVWASIHTASLDEAASQKLIKRIAEELK
ncbi:MAG TPA: DUF5753 domain-containing protein, partial [Micromonosporaceae bacterium]|nr:DUF5753 domain-containing protein [Micromonosporaceae bacterium]